VNIVVIGAGYVGLVTGSCFAELGNQVTCIDVNVDKITKLKQGILPIYEPGLEELIATNSQEHRLHFATNLEDSHEHPDVIFIAVGTPSDKEGAADIQYVLEAASSIGGFITQDCVIVDKSTVPVGMADRVSEVIKNELKKRGVSISFDVVSNPEFLREGAAIEDFMQPDRVIVGLNRDHARRLMQDLYRPIMRGREERLYFMNVKDAEMTKYVANAMLATRISFMNEMAILCEHMGVDIEKVSIGIGSDSRIGSAFLNAGCGYGGSCFPKDVRALIKMAEGYDVDPMILHAVEERNKLQKNLLSQKIITYFGEDLTGKKFGVWGLSFKPGTDDMREASSLILMNDLIERGAKLQAYDPAAMSVAKEMVPIHWLNNEKLILTEHQYDALQDVDAMVLVTEWKPFCYPDIAAMKKLMRQAVIFDGRNQYDPLIMKAAGFYYEGVGRAKLNN